MEYCESYYTFFFVDVASAVERTYQAVVACLLTGSAQIQEDHKTSERSFMQLFKCLTDLSVRHSDYIDRYETCKCCSDSIDWMSQPKALALSAQTGLPSHNIKGVGDDLWRRERLNECMNHQSALISVQYTHPQRFPPPPPHLM